MANKGSGGEKKSFNTTEYTNPHGGVTMGELWSPPGDTSGDSSDVQSAVALRGSDPLHYISLDKDGVRKGWTSHRSPGVIQVKCGDNVEGSEPSIVVEALNGDIILKAGNGKIRLQALDIDIQAIGSDNARGVLDLKSNEVINIDSKIVNVGSKRTTAMKILSTGIGEMTFKSSLTMYSGIGKCISSTVGKGGKDSKLGGRDFLEGSVEGGISSLLSFF
jgi:hypothetical protein